MICHLRGRDGCGIDSLRECLRVTGGKCLRFGGYLILIVDVGFLSVRWDICDWVI
jgi:hypothetical protein